MFKNFWRKITDRGVTPDLEFNVRNKIRIFNSSIFVIGATYLFYTLVGYLRDDYLAAGLTLLSWAISAFCLYLMSQRKYQLAYHITALLGVVFLFTFCVLYGESTLTYTFFLFIPVAAIVLFDDFRTCFLYFMLTLFVIVFTKIYFINFQPYYPYEEQNRYLGFLNITLTASLLYLAVRMFKFENLLYAREVIHQRDLIEEKNKEVLSSIHYAKRIQKALFASDSLLTKNLPEYFVLYKPKDIVSGDFYWAEQVDSGFMLAVCDCTGHGVPGAFMSLLNISFLNEIVMERKIARPNLVFDHLREDIIKVLNPAGTIEEGKDGMDAVLCHFNFNENTVDFACANNPVWVVREGQLMEFKADKMPIGMHEDRKPFAIQNLQLQKGDLVYLFTDGYADQFGGEKGKKFKYKQLKELFLANAGEPMQEQHKLLDRAIEDWKGELEQVDDILIIGVKI
jgi:sigma-B regulation protein RsbU (phosphoserine phosphatase)